ncbi:MAG: twin-arginine translocase TatA/TatE family subunit [Verrucomicrobiae bacterium]|nr:twin-arginine translocase TatA/TatE family subunit [Verrucomicrobiae bacterium]MCP5541289.1 twin-arginine translocase TatA/TatE family subunit [Akkermansiaceae bacterium]
MFGPIGFQEMLLIFLMFLLLFGAKRIPLLARNLGHSLGEFKRARDEFHTEGAAAENSAQG